MESMDKLVAVVKKLRAKDGCPWDRVQTHESLKAACIEEAAEVICGINVYEKTGNASNLKEELGDLLLQVVFHSQIAEEEGEFNLDSVIDGICEKMIRRHPHVFGEEKVELAADVPSVWEQIKAHEKEGKEDVTEFLSGAFDEAEALIGTARKRKGLERAAEAERTDGTGSGCDTAPVAERPEDSGTSRENGSSPVPEKQSTADACAENGNASVPARLGFASDYMKGAHPAILKRMVETNGWETTGYGLDEICEEAKKKIRRACGCDAAEVEFLVGGTQANAVMIDAFLRSYQGVLAARTGHISVHEAGAVEASGHKVLTLPQNQGKISAKAVEEYLERFYGDESWEHMVMPGMVYISHPTEYGTLYSREELCALHEVCHRYHIPLYLDGARLAYALACPESDVTLQDLAKCCDAFYIGGTKCGALFGEAVVIPDPNALPHLFTIIKQHGALLAKGRLLGIQFDALFEDDLYLRIGNPAIHAADRLRSALREMGFRLCFGSPTNQVFCVMKDSSVAALAGKVDYSFWEKADDNNTVVRFATDWGTTDEETDALIEVLGSLEP